MVYFWFYNYTTIYFVQFCTSAGQNTITIIMKSDTQDQTGGPVESPASYPGQKYLNKTSRDIKAHALQNVSSVKMHCKTSDIVAIIDIDGFMVSNQFYCKELGFMTVGGDEAMSFFFDIGLRKEELSPRDLTTCEYVEDFVHKIPFDLPWDTPAIHLSNLGAIVQQ